MDTAQIITGIVALVAIGIAVYAFVKSGKPVTVDNVLKEVQDTYSDLEKISETSRDLVLAAEQLWVTGKLPKGGRLDFVIDNVRKYFPEVPDEVVRTGAEAAVGWMKALQGKLSPGTTPPPAPPTNGTGG